MNKFDPYRLPIQAIWTDWDLAKFAAIAFVVGVIVGVLI
jgi:uncharacterized membrane-anchored protein YhcB (DUF1043 family)